VQHFQLYQHIPLGYDIVILGVGQSPLYVADVDKVY